MSFSVGHFLELPLMRDARLVGGARGVDTREVTWIAVSEGPVEDFVREGEIILTSGMGCDAHELAHIVREIAKAGAAAVCVGVGPGRFREAAGEPAIAVADETALPLIELPWEVRFSDITRSVVDRLLAERYGSLERDGVQQQLTNVVLDGLGFKGIAQSIDRMIGRPVVIFDRDMRPIAFSSGARQSLGQDSVERCRDSAEQLSAAQVDELGELLRERRHDVVPGLSPLGLGSGVGTAVIGSDQPVAYVYALAPEGDDFPECDRLVLQHASTAIAIEAQRQQTAIESEAAARGHFLWSLVSSSGQAAADLAAEGPMLGYSTRHLYEVMLADWTGSSESSPAVTAGTRGAEWLERQVQRVGERRGLRIHAARREDEMLILAEVPDGHEGALGDLAAAIKQELEGSRRRSVALGIARSQWRLPELSAAYREARDALVVGRIVFGESCLASGRDLGPFLMLKALSQDGTARQIVVDTLRGLTDYDHKTSRNLVGTLEVYLEEGGNASAAARRLYLNRHSLLYRLHKIEELTGRSLQSPSDRFVLELSLRLLRFDMLEPQAVESNTEAAHS